MSTTLTSSQSEALATLPGMVVRLGPLRSRLTDEEFEKFCGQNPELRIEMTSEGVMIIMLPVTPEGSSRNLKLTTRFGVWAEADGTGVGFESSAGFTLPNGAKRSPAVSWMRKERWDALTPEQRNVFTHICPDFVVELRSKTERLRTLQNKMKEYMANGAKLGWLIDPIRHQVHVYHADSSVEILDHPQVISGEPLLPGFVLRLDAIIH
jgi:Uma2 family endonuclease